MYSVERGSYGTPTRRAARNPSLHGIKGPAKSCIRPRFGIENASPTVNKLSPVRMAHNATEEDFSRVYAHVLNFTNVWHRFVISLGGRISSEGSRKSIFIKRRLGDRLKCKLIYALPGSETESQTRAHCYASCPVI